MRLQTEEMDAFFILENIHTSVKESFDYAY